MRHNKKTIKTEKKQRKNKIPPIHYRTALSFILFILPFSITCYTIINPQYNNKMIMNANQIKLKIKGPGIYSFLFSLEDTRPNRIYINSYEEYLDYPTFDFPYYDNDVLLKFSSKLTSCGSMFKGCSEITEIDLSSFDSSLVENINNMFENCKSLKSIKFGNFQTSKVENMKYVFKDCESLNSVDLSSFDTSRVVDFLQMFYNCKVLKSLDLSEFNTNSCISISNMFYGCENLKKIKLSNFNTSKVTNMNNIFYNCYALTSLDLTTFDLKSLKKMDNAFNGCQQLKVVKISSNFLFAQGARISQDDMIEYTDKSLVFCVDGLKSPKTFNIDTNQCSKCAIKKNNITSWLKNHHQNDFCCYETCNNCEYLGNAKYHNCTTCKTGYDLKIDINGYKNCYVKCDKLYYLDNNNNLICITESKCPNLYNKLIPQTNQCLKKCSNDAQYKYEYKNQCYKQCPKGTEESKTKSYFCEIIKIPTTQLIPIQIKTTQNAQEFITPYTTYSPAPIQPHSSISELTPIQMKPTQNAQEFITPYTTYSPPQIQPYSSITELTPIQMKPTQKPKETQEAEEFIPPYNTYSLPYTQIHTLNSIEEILTYIKIEDLIQYFSISEVNSGKDQIIIKRNSSKFIITSTHNQNRESNKTTINIGNCETKLKDHYNISKEVPLYILKIEVNITRMKIPKIEYEIYYPFDGRNLTKLDLSICQNEKIMLSIPVEINDIIDKYNPKSGYYNNICYTYTSEIGTDISLSDRREDFINNNMTLCEENCIFEEYDFISNKSICSCRIKIKLPIISEISIDKNKLYESFTDINNIANINVLKCYKLLLKKELLLKNLGVLILIPIIILLLLLSIIFCSCGYKKLQKEIELIIYAKKNFDRIKQINERSKNKSNQLLTTKNNNLLKPNKNNNKKILAPNKTKVKNSNRKDKTKSKAIPLKKNLFLKTSNNNINNNKKIVFPKQRSIPMKNIVNKKREEALNISGLTDLQIFELSKKIMKYNDYEMNNLLYQTALKIDKRTFLKFYLSSLKINNLFIFSFILGGDYNSKILKIFLFFLILITNLTVNSLFFNDSTMHVIYKEKDKFDIIYQIPQILYSSLISGLVTFILKKLSLTEQNILSIKREKIINKLNQKQKEVETTINKKIAFFFVFGFLFLLLFSYYIACFCAVYKNTQVHLVKDFLMSFCSSLIYPFFVCLLHGILRICSLKNDKRECIYKVSKLF